MGGIAAPGLTADATGGEIVHAGLHALIAEVVVAAKGIDLVGCQLAEVGNERSHLVDAAPEFVAQCKHTERGMVAIPPEDVLALLVEECHEQRVLVVETAPEG